MEHPHTLDTLYGDGTSRNYSYITAYDGKDTPVIGNSPYGDTTALTRVDAQTTRGGDIRPTLFVGVDLF